ncbi:MAG: hypothetical protein WBE76_28945 [Terracidiphilus sp.]
MPSHNDKEPDHSPNPHGSEEIDASQGFEQTDVGVTGIVVFLTSLAILVVVVAVLCYGIGKVFNAELNREDGPNSKWTKTVDIRQLGNLPNSPELQNKVAELTQSFPTPRLQTDDGNEDLAELHAREDLLLDNYSWIDRSKGTVRIPVERAMELIAQRGLPVMPAQQLPPPMTGDVRPHVIAPLTDGFARTAYEQQQEKDREAAEKIAAMQQQ